MKMPETIRRILSITLTILMIISIIPYASAEETVPADVDELMALFDPGVAAPKQGSILKEPETMIVDAGKGRSIDVMSKPGGGRKLYTAAEGAEVTVYARESGYVLGIVKGTSAGGWMREKFLAAADNDAESLISRGLQYELGDGVKQDYIKAEECYKQAIELGSTEAMTRLAMLYLKDGYSAFRGAYRVFNKERIPDPIELLFEAAEADDPTALLILGDFADSDYDIYWDGIDFYDRSISLDDGLFISVCSNSITPGSIFNDYLLATDQKLDDFCSEHGMGNALDYYKQAYALGSEEAIVCLDVVYFYVLCDCYKDEDAAEQSEAQEWLEKRAEEDDPYALFILAVTCEGEESEEYFSLAEKAAIKQNNARVLIMLGIEKLPNLILDDPIYNPDNYPEPKLAEYSAARSLFRKAAKIGNSGDIFWIVRALMRYDEEFFYGSDDEDYDPALEDKAVGKMAKEFINIALSRCNAEDLDYIGEMLMFVPYPRRIRDLISAECYLAAVEKGNIASLQYLANQFDTFDVRYWKNSEFITKNYAKRAFNVTLEATENGFYPKFCYDDEYLIVWMYENGYGCRKNPEEAQKWAEIIGNKTDISDEDSEDSSEPVEELDAPDVETEKEVSLLSADVGDYVLFGSYEQDNDASNGKEEIEWLVLAREGSRILVISKYALDCQPYDSAYSEAYWDTCSLREWLNSTFLNTAFTEEERAMIPSVAVSVSGAFSDYKSSTADQVFLLNTSEAEKYFRSDSDRRCKGTAYCFSQGAEKGEGDICSWWLRSSDAGYRVAMGVNKEGYFLGTPNRNSSIAVRPVLWIETGT